MLKKNQKLSAIPITDLNHLGYGVAKIDGQTVFIGGAVTGDICDIKIVKVNKTWAAGIVEQIRVPSPHRLSPDAKDVCPAAARCGGCVFGGVTYAHETEQKHREVVFALKKAGLNGIEVAPVTVTGEISRYRNKAQYPVGTDKNGHLFAGFYAPRSHAIVPVGDCLLQPEGFSPLLHAFLALCDTYQITAYREEDGEGLLRHVCIRTAPATGALMLIAVINGNALPHADAIAETLMGQFPALRSVCVNRNKTPGNVIFGKEFSCIAGDDFIEDVLCGLTFRISPPSFYQVNRDAAELLYKKGKELLGLRGSETLLDLYCGTGTIGLTMADSVKRLIGIEIVPEAIENAKTNAALNGIANASFYAADAAGFLPLLDDVSPDVVVVDPPRRGLAPAVIADIIALAPEKILYISCAPDTLARDLSQFTAAGYTAGTAFPFDLFPRTSHVETVCLLTRAPTA